MHCRKFSGSSVPNYFISSCPHSSGMSRIQEFYTEQKIFITGGTGFLGRILIEKLLRSCPKIGTLYLLIRAKKGKTAQERIDTLLVDPVFEVLRNEYPDVSNKIVGVNGDISGERLGLSTSDYARLVDEVSVIFHLAATVKFNEKLDKAVSINVNSVKSIVDIAKACKNLKAGIYVSTAYSNCVRKSINEKLCPPPLSYAEANELIEDVGNKTWSEDEVESFTEKVLGKWPNTYSFTKAIAEGVVADFAKEMPFAVFRPSIVTTAYREPIPGWLSGPMGLPGLCAAVGLGVLHVSLVDLESKVDIVPVDYVCNALISCAWETAITKRRYDEDIPVYNYVSGNDNPITWKRLDDLAEMFGLIYPTNAAVYYISVIKTKSTRLYSILEFFLHFLPAIMIDIIAGLIGRKPGLYKVALQMRKVALSVGYFGTQQWDFETERIPNLWKRIEPQDKLIFPFSIKNVDWDEHAMQMIRGLRKYLLGDRDGNEEEARRRHFFLYIIHTIVRLTFAIFVLWIIWKIFCQSRSTTASMLFPTTD